MDSIQMLEAQKEFATTLVAGQYRVCKLKSRNGLVGSSVVIDKFAWRNAAGQNYLVYYIRDFTGTASKCGISCDKEFTDFNLALGLAENIKNQALSSEEWLEVL